MMLKRAKLFEHLTALLNHRFAPTKKFSMTEKMPPIKR